MSRFKRLVVVLLIANGLSTLWFFSTLKQRDEANADFMAYLSSLPNDASAEVFMQSPAAMWVNSAAAYHATAYRWTGIGYVASLVLLVGGWVMSGTRKPN